MVAVHGGSPNMIPDVVTLTVDDIAQLNATGNPRIDEIDIRSILEASAAQSFWVPATGEFILVAPWRSRSELPHVHTLWSFRNDRVLIDAAVRASRSAGAAALVMLESRERRKPSFYQQYGFERIEIIRTYEHTEPGVLGRQYDPDVQRFTRVTREESALRDAITSIDHAAFPWFWWNSADEFDEYLAFPGVEVWAGIQGEQVVSYFGMTAYQQWAHLDRIAVAPDRQRTGLGRSTLAFAAQQMVRGGAVRIGLSTQNANRVSRRLYESVGFRHTRPSDYDVYGVVFDAEWVYRPSVPDA